jgi:hypothetical protein
VLSGGFATLLSNAVVLEFDLPTLWDEQRLILTEYQSHGLFATVAEAAVETGAQ